MEVAQIIRVEHEGVGPTLLPKLPTCEIKSFGARHDGEQLFRTFSCEGYGAKLTAEFADTKTFRVMLLDIIALLDNERL